MIALTGNIDLFLAALTVQEKEFNTELATRYAKWTKRIASYLVEITPQWSSNTAQNWTYAVGSVDTSYTESAMKGVASKLLVGSSPGVEIGLLKIAEAVSPEWAQPVFIGNFTPMTDKTGEYLLDGFASGDVKLRAENRIPANGALIAYIMDFAKEIPV